MKRFWIQLAFLGLFTLILMSGKMVLWLGIFVLSLLIGKVYGRFYCGYICPMNTTMQWAEKVSQRFGWQRGGTPKFLSHKWIPWGVLVLMGVSMILSKRILKFDMPVLIVLIVISIGLTLRYKQEVFHNHVCPYGALLKATGHSPVYTTQVDYNACIGCHKCEKVCPSGAIQVNTNTRKASVDPSICHQCTDNCAGVCPVNAIAYKK